VPRGRPYWIICLALVVRLVIEIARSHDPHTGFTSLIDFGDKFAAQRIPQLTGVPVYTYANSWGYDGQFYAQVAVAGNPLAAPLRTALDSPGYRGRRVLLPLAAHLVGLGRPAWVVQVYALANLICFLILAVLLARWWFPPTDLDNLLRWTGTLFGAGMMVSVTRSLTDGPALLAIAIAARQLEVGRARLAAVVFAAAGLVRETSVLACAALFPPDRDRRAWRAAVPLVALGLLPTVAWTAFLIHHFAGGAGARNFDWPLVAYGKKVAEVWGVVREGRFGAYTRIELPEVIALGTQAVFLIARPRPRELWWRIGAGFILLWALLGWAIWEGWPSAASRALLPMTLAFNRLAPRVRRGLALLIAGNLTVLSAPTILETVPTEQTVFARGVSAAYASGWHGPEHKGRRTWRWASGTARLVLDNPTPEPLAVTIGFELRAVTPRAVTWSAPGTPPARASLADTQWAPGSYGPLALPPGQTVIEFQTDTAPWVEPGPGGRPLAFSVGGLFVSVAGR
jgi:hypothetical protein